MDQLLRKRVESAAIRRRLFDRRPALLRGLPIELVATMPLHPIPGDQLRSDLSFLIETPVGPGGEPVLRIWLENARDAAMSPEAEQVFHEALATLTADPTKSTATDAAPATPPQPSPGSPAEALDRFLKVAFGDIDELARLLHYRLGPDFTAELPAPNAASPYIFAVVQRATQTRETGRLLDALESERPYRREEIARLRAQLSD